MKTSKKIILFLLVLIAILTLIIIFVSYKQQNTIILNVIDGDTFTLTNGEKVRLIGIDAPERGDNYYNESKHALEDLILNKIVVLEKDISNKDKYGRLLRYVYIDGEMVNLYLVSEGYAEAKEYSPDLRYSSQLKEAENDAKANSFGIWYSEDEGDDLCLEYDCPAGTNYIGSKNSNKYHSCDSRFAKMISPDNIICFTSEDDALNQGYIGSE